MFTSGCLTSNGGDSWCCSNPQSFEVCIENSCSSCQPCTSSHREDEGVGWPCSAAEYRYIKRAEPDSRPEPESEPTLGMSALDTMQCGGSVSSMSSTWLDGDESRGNAQPSQRPRDALTKLFELPEESTAFDAVHPQVAEENPQANSAHSWEGAKSRGFLQKLATEAAPTRNAPEGQPEEDEPKMYNAKFERIKCLLVSSVTLIAVAAIVAAIALTGMANERTFCSDAEAQLRSCEICGGGTLFLPLGGDWEKRWHQAVRVFAYTLALLWCFLGVQIVCDEFMGAIENITSTERPVWVAAEGGVRHKIYVPVWNETMANLTLMALGSSAPEILLSAAEICIGGFFAGDLGPSTIVGSAAFNLFTITAVCVSAIPPPEVRKIEKIEVFSLTAAVSIFAYLWVLVMLLGPSPNKVELWEALSTLGFFFLLLIAAFTIDRCTSRESDRLAFNDKEEQRLMKIRDEMVEGSKKEISLEAVRATLALGDEALRPYKWSRAACRRTVISAFMGGKRKVCKEAVFESTKTNYLVLECAGQVSLTVTASRPFPYPVSISYETVEGNAKQGVRFRHTEGQLHFQPFEMSKDLKVDIIDNEHWDPSEEFYVKLFDLRISPQAEGKTLPKEPKVEDESKLGLSKAAVWVINDDEPGTLDFQRSEVLVSEAPSEAKVTVKRSYGVHGKISCEFETVENSAIGGEHFTPVEGTLEFADGESLQTISIPILQMPKATSLNFSIRLKNPSTGVFFSPYSHGGYSFSSCEVILSSSGYHGWFSLCAFEGKTKTAMSMSQWWSKLPEALYCNGSAEEQAEAGLADWVMHVLALFWKVVFLVVPPPLLCGGWPAFFVALVMIAGMTCLINDTASLLGCSMGLHDYITAITLVALGTSLPDTMASRVSAKMDSTADNSIGNVTGSNSVNVFLGLGISWTIAAVYWGQVGRTEDWDNRMYKGSTYKDLFGDVYPDGGFIVLPGSLWFSVVVFSIEAVICICILVTRRRLYGGELGGPKSAQLRDSLLLFSLWLTYLAISIIYGVTQDE